MKRALNLSAWTQAVVFLVLFLVGRWLYVWSYAAVNVSCPRPPPQDYHVAACVGHECLGFDILVKDATPLPGSFDDNDSAFEGHYHEHHHYNTTPGMTYDISPWHMHLPNVAAVATMQLCLPIRQTPCGACCAKLVVCKCRVPPSFSSSGCNLLCHGGPGYHWGCLRCTKEDTDTQKVWHHWQPTGRLLFMVLVRLPLAQSTHDMPVKVVIMYAVCLDLLLHKLQ